MCEVPVVHSCGNTHSCEGKETKETNMLSPDDTSHITQVTESFERLPRSSDGRSPTNERRQSTLQQKDTDVLPSVSVETPHAKIAWRQVIQLREENRHLRFELEDQRKEMQQLLTAYNSLQMQFDQEATSIHGGYEQEREQYQSHVQALMEERNHLQEKYSDLERRYMDLYHTFQDAVEEEAHKMVTDAAQTIEM